MKTGRTIEELRGEINRLEKTKRDFLPWTNQLSMGTDGASTLQVGQEGYYEVTSLAHNQIADRIGIPRKYYDRMREEAPRLLDANVNHWFREKPEERLVRTLDGKARAFLSNRYRVLDNVDLAQVVVPQLEGMNLKVESAELTERRFYLKAIFPGMEAEIKKGDPVLSGIAVSNSEVGEGRLTVSPLVWRQVCSNGMIGLDAFGKYHVGRAGSTEDGTWELLKDDAREKSDIAFWMQVRDVVASTLSGEVFHSRVEALKEATTRLIPDPNAAIKVLESKGRISEAESAAILNHLWDEGDRSQYGLIQAITRASQEVEDYDRATELERLGGQVLELPRHDWRELTAA